MFTTWDKALVPFVGGIVAVLVYFGVISEDQGQGFTAAVVPAVIVFGQALLTYFTPNKS